MPGNEVGDRVHNFFAQDNLSQGQHSQVVDGNWPLNNNLWVGNQKQIDVQSSNPKNYNPPQSELERGHGNHRQHVPHGLNFTHTALRPEFARSQSQSQQTNLNGYMYGRQVFQTRPDEANFLGVDTESDRNNVNQRGFPIYESQQGGVSEQITKNSVRSDSSDTPVSFDLFGGQQQMNSQHPGLLQPSPQQQSGYGDIQQLQQQLMFRKLQEFQRQKELRQLDARQQNSVNHVSSFARQAPGSHPHGLINDTPISEASNYPWAELTAGNTNWLQCAPPAMQGSSSGLVFSPEQAQMPHSMGFAHQQVDQSLYGVPVSSSRGTLNQFPQVATDKTTIHQMPTHINSFPGNQYAVFPEQLTVQDGTSVSRQGLPGKSLFGHTSGQGPNNGINKEHLRQLNPVQRNASVQEFRGSQELIGPSEILQDKTALEATSSHSAVSLDPTEEKILFRSDDNIWDAFGKSSNMGGGASNLLDGGGFFSGLPSIQSGSWSALMQSAVAETSSNDIGLQEEWTGMTFQNPELPSGSQQPSTFDNSEKRQTALDNDNLQNASVLSHGSVPLTDGSNMSDNYQSAMGFPPHGKQIPYEHGDRLQLDSTERLNQRSSGGSKWLNRGALQKQQAEGSQNYENASLSMGAEMNAKNISGHWSSQQCVPSQPNNWNAIETVPPSGEATLNINENEKSLRHSQSNDQKRVMHEEMVHGDGTWRFNSLPNSNLKVEPVKSSMGSPQINREGFAVNNAAAVLNSSTMQVSEDTSQFLPNNRQLNYWKNVDSSMKSKGSEGSGKSRRHLNKGPQDSESSFNSSDKEENKMHEMEGSSRKENSNDSYRSNLSHLATTIGLRENLSLDSGDLRSLPGGKQSSSNQAGRKTSGLRKFQYHPMGNLDEDAEVPYGTRQGTHSQAMSQPYSRVLKGQDQGYFGPSKFFGQVPKSSAETGKGQVPDLQGVANLSDDAPSRGIFPGHVPNMFAPFDRSVGLSPQNKASQSSQNMLELLHKVDQSRDRGAVRHFSSSERNLSSEILETENSDGSVGQLQRSQSSNSQGFGLQLAPPSQRLPLPNLASPNTVQTVNSNSSRATPDIRDKGHAELSPSYSVSLPPSQDVSHAEFKNDRIGISGQIGSETSMHKMEGNISSALSSGFPYSRSQLQNQHMIGARGQTFPNHFDNESFDGHAHNRQTDESCGRQLTSQSLEGSLPNAAGYGLYDNAGASHPRERVQAPQSSEAEKLPASQPCTTSGMPQHGAFSKVLPNLWTNVPAQQHHSGTQADKGHSNLSQSHQLNIVESHSSGMHNVEDQHAERRGNIPSKFGAGSMNSQDFVSGGEQPAKECPSPKFFYGNMDQTQMINGPPGKESIIKHLSDTSPVHPTSTQRDLEAFGRSLKPNNFHQSYSLLNQMRSMKSTDNDPNNKGLKRLKRPDSFLGGQQVAPWAAQPNERNNMMGDASACCTTVPSGDSKMLSFSGPGRPADNVEQNMSSQLGNEPSRDTFAFGQNESQNYMPSNSTASIKAEHSHISPQMAPSWFEQYGIFKNGQMLSIHDSQKAAIVKTVEQPFSLGRSSASLDMHNSKEQVNAAADTSQVSVSWQNSAPPSVAVEHFSSPPLPTIIGGQMTLRPKKRKNATSDLLPWHKEVSQGSRNLQAISMAAVEWAKSANRLTEKVEDDGEVIEDALPVVRPKRRLMLTTQLMQQLLRPPPAAILSTDASSNYESVAYFVARLAFGDACSLVSSAKSHSDVPRSGANLLSVKNKRSDRIDDQHLSEAMEDFMGRARKLENDLLRLDKSASVLDLRVECQDLKKFSVINRFAKFHGRGQAGGAETSSSDIVANAQKPFPQRYVTAVPLPKNLPDRVQCLSL